MTKPITANDWIELDTAMTELAKARDCGCELAGLEGAMDLVRCAAKRAAPDFAAHDRGEELSKCSRAHIDLAYYALVIVATIVSKENMLQMIAYDEHEAGRLAIATMIERIRPYLDRREEQFHRATFDAQLLFKVPDDCGGPEGFSIKPIKPSKRWRDTFMRE